MPATLMRITLLLTLSVIAGGCDRFSSTPGLSSPSEARVMERFVSAYPGQIESPWASLETDLGQGKPISFKEFLKVTGYEMQEPPRVECRIWRNSQGEWLAVAYDPDAKSLSGIKSYMRR